MPEVDDFGAAALHDAAHNIDGGIVSIEQTCGCYDADFVFGLVRIDLLHGSDLE
jgi:hypothetical protein